MRDAGDKTRDELGKNTATAPWLTIEPRFDERGRGNLLVRNWKKGAPMVGEKIRVFCVDDDEATSAFYRLVLNVELDMELVGACASTVGLLPAVEAAKPSVLLLDLLIPGCDTLHALEELRSRFPALPVLVVSGLDEEAIVAEAFRRGASGFFVKAMDLTELTSVIRRAAAGERVNTKSSSNRALSAPNPGATRQSS